jgi:hypothetical protein
MARIVEIAAPLSGDVFAAIYDDGTAIVWSLSNRSAVARLEIAHDFGGRRAALVGDRLVVGRYTRAGKLRSGVRAYDLSGGLAWERTDLKQPQHLNALPRGQLAVGLEYSSLQVLDSTGGTVARVRGADSIYGSDATEAVLVEGTSGWIALHEAAPPGKRLWRRRIESFAVLDAALGTHEVAITDAAGNVTAFGLDGEPKWSWLPPDGEHVLRIGWAQEACSWPGLLVPFEHAGSCVLITLDSTGELVSAKDVGTLSEASLIGGGEFLVVGRNGGGEVLRVRDAETVWSFEP